MIIDDYFASIERSLRQNRQASKIEEPILCLASDDYNGLLRCRLLFWDESYLDIKRARTRITHTVANASACACPHADRA